MAETDTRFEEIVGLPDGHVDHNGEQIVYEYDEDGNFIGWSKQDPTQEKSI